MTVMQDFHVSRSHERDVTAEALIRETHRLFDACGLSRGPSWVARQVRRYLSSRIEGLPFEQFLFARVELSDRERAQIREHPEMAYVLSYADPTGERAVANVLRERGF